MSIKGPLGLVPFSKPVKWSLGIIVALTAVTLGIEYYMLQQPDKIAPFSWAFWFLAERAPWLPIPLLGFFAALSSHFFWFRRPDDFWAPIRLRTAVIIAAGTLASIAATQAWLLLTVMAAMMAGVVLAHRYWFRIESFGEHLAQFHDDEESE